MRICAFFRSDRFPRASTGELPYSLLWSCDMLCRRTFRNLTSSFEGWAYREGLHGRLAALERRELLESAAAEGGGRRLRGWSSGSLKLAGSMRWASARWPEKTLARVRRTKELWPGPGMLLRTTSSMPSI